jgi:hypothetical protein
MLSRLLTAPRLGPRQTATAADEWSIRLSALATLGRYDGLICVVDEPGHARFAYNAVGDPALDQATRSALEETRHTGTTVQTRSAVRLADGRVAGAAMVAPLIATDTVGGVLIALRVGRSFAAADALTASGIADLVGLELAREAAARRDESHRRQAFALYELARIALFGERLQDTLQDVTALLTSAFEHDVAQIWMFEPTGALERWAATPREDRRTDRMRPSEYEVVAEALQRRRTVRVGRAALGPRVPAETAELILAPLRDGAGASGVLLLGRVRGRYADEDEELAAVLGRFIGRLASRESVDRLSARPGRVGSVGDRAWAEEPQLTGG